MRVTIDGEKCQGHGRCFSLAPDLFDSDDLGNGFVVAEGDLREDQIEGARLAVLNCPEHAIELED